MFFVTACLLASISLLPCLFSSFFVSLPFVCVFVALFFFLCSFICDQRYPRWRKYVRRGGWGVREVGNRRLNTAITF